MSTYRSRANNQTSRHANGVATFVIGAVLLAVIAVAAFPQLAGWWFG